MSLRFCITRTIAALVTLGVAGCAGTSVTPGPLAANPPSQGEANGLRSTALRVKPDNASYRRALYIADGSNNNVKILTNTYYRELGAITNGISGPTNLSMDQVGNLYVANGSDVVEYAPRGTSPSFTYSAEMLGVSDVAVDRHGNVYAAGLTGEYYDTVNEYF